MDVEMDAARIERARKKTFDRRKDVFLKIFHSKEGRAFVGFLMEAGNIYGAIDDPVDEGMRRLVLSIRSEAAEYNLLDQWRLAESETEDFQAEIDSIMREDEYDDGLHL